jgi:diaminohydroxyphosphoribosylaminopyrimidine deaminase/5-amino-6-(5-phosphoribosylamino)uracil reductase
MECIKVQDIHNIPALLILFYELKIISVLVEGGAKVLDSFIRSGSWDEAVVIQSDQLLRTGIPAPALTGTIKHQFKLKNDTIKIIQNPDDLSNT